MTGKCMRNARHGSKCLTLTGLNDQKEETALLATLNYTLVIDEKPRPRVYIPHIPTVQFGVKRRGDG